MKNMQVTKLKKDYVSVGGSYGGNQGWFKPAENESEISRDINQKADQNDAKGIISWRQLTKRKRKTLADFGCGLIGASDIVSHLFGKTFASREEYQDYIVEMEKKFFHILPKLGISGVLLAFNLNLYFFSNRKKIKIEKGCRYHARWAVLPKNILPKIKEMLSNDIPVIIAIGPGFFRKNKVIFYNKVEEPQKDMGNRVVYKPSTKTKDHYVTVTGVEEYSTPDSKSDEKNVMLEISSWGRKYYVNYNEYVDYVKKNDNFYFSNILYIKKK